MRLHLVRSLAVLGAIGGSVHAQTPRKPAPRPTPAPGPRITAKTGQPVVVTMRRATKPVAKADLVFAASRVTPPIALAKREAMRQAVAASLKISVAKLPVTFKAAASSTADPTAMDVGTAVVLHTEKWQHKIGSSGFVVSGVKGASIVGKTASYFTKGEGSFGVTLSLPSKPVPGGSYR